VYQPKDLTEAAFSRQIMSLESLLARLEREEAVAEQAAAAQEATADSMDRCSETPCDFQIPIGQGAAVAAVREHQATAEVRCCDCRSFIPDTIGDGLGGGRCSADGEGSRPEGRWQVRPVLWARAERRCGDWAPHVHAFHT
jgi:hypothetical protein